MTKKLLYLLFPLLALALVGCAPGSPMDQLINGTPTQQAAADISASTLQATPLIEEESPTATPWLIETPTPDTWLTQIAADQEHDDKQLNISNNDMTLAAINKEARETDTVLHNLSLTSVKEHDDAQGTQASMRSTDVSINATGTIDANNFIRELPTIQVAQTRVAYTAVQDLTGIAVEWLIMVMAVVGVIIIALVVLVPSRLPAKPEEPITEALPHQPSYWIKDPNTEGYKKTPPPPGGITEAWLAWAHMVRISNSPSYKSVCVAGSPYPNSVAYKPIHEWAEQNKLIARDPSGQTVLTERGELVLDNELLKANYSAPSPTADLTPIPVPLSRPAQDYPAQDSGGGGEGEGLELPEVQAA